MSIDRSIRALLPLFVLLLAVPSQAQAPQLASSPPRIVTTATEEVEIAPDRAVLTFTVETRARTAAAAGTENARIQAAVLDTLRRVGIASAQLRTQGVSISPEYEYPREGGRPTVVGYQAQNSIQVEVRQIALIGTVIDAGLSRGATNVGGLRFFASSTESATREAMRKAVQRTRADADAIAEAAGGRIAGVLEIIANPGSSGALMPEMLTAVQMRMADRADAPTPIESGMLKVTVSVEARFLFSPK
ncbi:MAG: SIMPL domain-containing protein [Gemmatimonadaceae bacterium]|nr:SIMPL domain-containing protein [Gemmatimonadaceae bacterium]